MWFCNTQLMQIFIFVKKYDKNTSMEIFCFYNGYIYLFIINDHSALLMIFFELYKDV